MFSNAVLRPAASTKRQALSMIGRSECHKVGPVYNGQGVVQRD